MTETVNPVPPISEVYLVDKVEVGDYVDIGIDYENKQSFVSNNYTSTTNALTGWRVLRKSGSGETGTVKLVSAGCPLTFYHSIYVNSSIKKLENLNKEIILVASKEDGFIKNGFESNNLSTIFIEDKYIDTSKGIHALGCGSTYNNNSGSSATAYEPLNELEEAYALITGQTKTMTELYGSYTLGTKTLQSVAGEKWKDNYTDLLGNGQEYWFAGTSKDNYNFWGVDYSGFMSGGRNERGIRLVVSLQAGVKLDSNNIGDGLSSSSAYSITK